MASEGELSVALDVSTDPDLELEGLARELVSRLQQLRRASGLAVTDRIKLGWSSADPQVRLALDRHRDFIAGEVLALSVEEVEIDAEPISVDGAR